MNVNVALFVWIGVFVIGLFVVEAYTAARGIPTISERIQSMGRSAPLVVVVASFIAGVLLQHFFG